MTLKCTPAGDLQLDARTRERRIFKNDTTARKFDFDQTGSIRILSCSPFYRPKSSTLEATSEAVVHLKEMTRMQQVLRLTDNEFAVLSEGAELLQALVETARRSDTRRTDATPAREPRLMAQYTFAYLMPTTIESSHRRSDPPTSVV